MEVYAAQIDRMDRNVGRILDALRRTGQEENTLILFLADNGGCAEESAGRAASTTTVPKQTRDGRPMRPGNAPSIMPGGEDTFASYGIGWANASNTPFRRYKHWVHEGGIATPLIARWPGGIARRGAITHENGHLIDLMATCVDVSGAQVPGRVTTASAFCRWRAAAWRPRSRGKKIARDDAFYWEHEGNRAVVDGRWKLVSRFPDRWELYDLEADRCELHDLAGRRCRAERMVARYERWADRCNVLPWDEVRKIPVAGA